MGALQGSNIVFFFGWTFVVTIRARNRLRMPLSKQWLVRPYNLALPIQLVAGTQGYELLSLEVLWSISNWNIVSENN